MQVNQSEMHVKLKIKSPEDFWSGLVFIGIGLLAVYLSWDYPMGTALRMGPGYFPTWLGALMAGFGVIITFLSLKTELQAPEEISWGFRPWIVLSASLVVFGLLMDYAEAGFVPALAALTLGSALAHKDVHWGETIVLTIFSTVFFVALFVYLIGLPYRLFWWE